MLARERVLATDEGVAATDPNLPSGVEATESVARLLFSTIVRGVSATCENAEGEPLRCGKAELLRLSQSKLHLVSQLADQDVLVVGRLADLASMSGIARSSETIHTAEDRFEAKLKREEALVPGISPNPSDSRRESNHSSTLSSCW